MKDPAVTLSVVSHGQNALVNSLLEDLQEHCGSIAKVLVTENVRDRVALQSSTFRNATPNGFGANHNAAFRHCETPYFCVCNPDIRLRSDPFPSLVQAVRQDRAAVAGPLVRHPSGAVEDSARRFPTFASLAWKAFAAKAGPDYPIDRGVIDVDWIAGMFMLFRAEVFRSAGGFDERYFLYYEDVDLCRRIHASGARVLYEPRSEVIHDARRGSRRDPRLALRHAVSMGRYLFSRS
jgi:GT2 family glycosyltransferase